MANQQVTRTVNLVINGKQAKVSMNELNRSVSAATSAFRKLKEADNPQLYAQRKAQLQKLIQTRKELNAEIYGGAQANKTFLSSFKTMAGGLIAGSAAFAVIGAIREGVNIFKEFEEAMAGVAAISGATGDALQALRDDAQRLGESTVFTATEVAQLQTEFAKKGFDTDQILAATEATLALAAATGEDLAGSVDVASSTLNAFGLPASETQRVVDVMAKSFSTSALDLEKFRESMKFVGPVAKGANIDLETTTAVLGKLADKGLSGSIAGNGLKKLLGEMADPASKLSKELGFTVNSSDDLTRAFDVLSKKGIDLAKASELTGERSKVALLALTDGVDLDGFASQLDNAAGSAQQMAEVRLDTIGGDMKLMRSATEGLAIAFGERIAPALRAITQGFTSLLGFLTRNIGAIAKLTKLVLLGATAWTVYKVAVWASTKANKGFLTGLLKTEAGLKLQKMATYAAAAAKALFTGNLKKARVAMMAFNRVALLNPFGLIAVAVVATVAAITLLGKKLYELGETNKVLKPFRDFVDSIGDAFRTVGDRAQLFYNEVLRPMISYIADVATSVYERFFGSLDGGSLILAVLGKGFTLLLTPIKLALGGVILFFEQITLGAVKARLAFQQISNGLFETINAITDSGAAEYLEQLFGFKFEPIELIDTTDAEKSLERTRAKIAQVRKESKEAGVQNRASSAGGTSAGAGASGGDSSSSGLLGGGTSTEDKAAKAAAKSKAARDKELEEIQKGFETINEQREKFLAGNLAKDEKELADLDAKYETQFNKLLAYQQRILELEGISDEERAALISTNNLIKEQLEDAHLAELDRIKTERDTAAGIKKAEDDETLRVALLSERELEIEGINAHYDKLQELARGNKDALDLINKQRVAAIDKVNVAANAKEVADAIALRDAKISIAQSLAGNLTSLANLMAKQGEESSNFQKAVAIFKIGVDTASAISSALAASYASTPEPIAATLKFLAVSGSILSAASNIKSTLGADVPTAPQFYGGGLTDVRGEQDGRNYRARNVGSFQAGGRYNSPSVGLIAERGPELVIPNNIYTNPANANVMAGLESAIARQYYSGGATNNVSNVTNNGADSEMMQAVMATLNRLNAKLDEPIQASTYLDLQDLEDAQDRRRRSQSLANYG